MWKKSLTYLIGLWICAVFPLNAQANSTCFHFVAQKLSIPEELNPLEASDCLREFKLGIALAEKSEAELAIQSFKRAEVSAPESPKEIRMALQYAQLWVYYQNYRFEEATRYFEKVDLLFAGESFPQFKELLLMMFESYERSEQFTKADHVLERIKKSYPHEVQQRLLSRALFRKDFKKIEDLSTDAPQHEFLNRLSQGYQKKIKSPKLAKWLGILCPGAGYLYAGQTKSAITSFLINGLLIAASSQLFVGHYYALGLLLATFEAGWYVGGVLGGTEAAKSFNNQLYEDFESKVTFQEQIIYEQKLDFEL